MQAAEDAYESESEESENVESGERPTMNKSEKTVVTAFINEVFKRSLEILKNMQAGSEDILAPNLTVEESRFVKEFVKGIFKRAVEVMVKHVNSVSYETEDIKQLDPSVQDAAIERLKEVITREVKKSLQKELLREKRLRQNVADQEIREISNQEAASSPSEKCTMPSARALSLDSQEFIVYGGRNSHGYHIIYMDPAKAPRKHAIADHDYYLKIMDTLLTLTDSFLAEHTNQQPFILVYRCQEGARSKRLKFQWMFKFYGILRDRYRDNLVKFIVYNPEIKFKAMLKLCKAFMRKELSRKLLIVTDPDSFAKELQGLVC